jgi:hypothetical protein
MKKTEQDKVYYLNASEYHRITDHIVWNYTRNKHIASHNLDMFDDDEKRGSQFYLLDPKTGTLYKYKFTEMSNKEMCNKVKFDNYIQLYKVDYEKATALKAGILKCKEFKEFKKTLDNYNDFIIKEGNK